jgi:competence protein ComFB
MNVHNLIEEIVISDVNKLYDQLKITKPVWFSCDCENCRMDAISYVLNRIPPKYVVSGRGVIHNASDLKDNQLLADINALGLEAIQTVNSVKRPYHTKPLKEGTDINGPAFNFPLFTGTVFDGSTFEPLSDASIYLKQNGKPVIMMDQTWNNPCRTYETTAGTYSFWIKPFPAKNTGIKQQFNFTIEVSAPKYEQVLYTFEVPVISGTDNSIHINSLYSFKIQDLFLFHEDIKNPME